MYVRLQLLAEIVSVTTCFIEYILMKKYLVLSRNENVATCEILRKYEVCASECWMSPSDESRASDEVCVCLRSPITSQCLLFKSWLLTYWPLSSLGVSFLIQCLQISNLSGRLKTSSSSSSLYEYIRKFPSFCDSIINNNNNHHQRYIFGKWCRAFFGFMNANKYLISLLSITHGAQ